MAFGTKVVTLVPVDATYPGPGEQLRILGDPLRLVVPDLRLLSGQKVSADTGL